MEDKEMSDETMRKIVERVKSRRLQLDYSYQDLAGKTGLSKSTLQRYESGSIKNIPLDKLKDLAKGLQVSPEWLMGWDSPENNESSDPDIRRIERARKNMSKRDKEKMMNLLKISFEEFFSDEFQDDDINE